MPAQVNSVLRDRLQYTDKKDAIELCYKLLSSGHSVSEILEVLNSTQSKAEQGNAAAAEYSRTVSERAPTGIAAEIAFGQGAQANVERIPGLSASQLANDGGAEEAQATESTPLMERGSDNREQLLDNLSGSEPRIGVLAGSQTPTNCNVPHPPGDQERIRPGKFPGVARRFAFWALCITAVASAAAVGFSILDVVWDTQLMSARVPSRISGGIETAAIPRAEADRAEAVENTTNLEKPATDTDVSRAPEPLRPAEPDPAASDSAQRVAAEVQPTSSPAQPQAQEVHGSEAGQPDATPVSALAAAVSDPVTLHEEPETASTQAAEAANDAEPAQPHTADPAAAATPTTATMQALKPGPETHDVASVAAIGAEYRIEGDRGGGHAASPAETARAEQPDAARPPAREAAAPAPVPRVAEIARAETPLKTAEADALVARGDAFFAAGDLASARPFYEYAVAGGNGVAALRLGGTFDPGFLARAHIGRVQGDAAIALYWYRRARDLGNGDAEILLEKMEKPAR